VPPLTECSLTTPMPRTYCLWPSTPGSSGVHSLVTSARLDDAAEQDIETGILAVCDVYDALISTRVYRQAWSRSRALGLLRKEAGTAFDPRCVAALERILADEPGDGRPAEVAHAARSHARLGSPTDRASRL
jgi:hypothetical protein